MTTLRKTHPPRTTRSTDGGWTFDFDGVDHVVDFALHGRTACAANEVEVEDWLRDASCGRSRDYFNDVTPATLEAYLARCPSHLLEAIEAVKRDLEGQIDPPTRSRRRLRRRREDGCDLDPLLVATRDPEPWDRIERESRPRGVARVVVNTAVLSLRKPKDLLWRGAAACAVADLYTSAGVSVEIVSASVSADISSQVRQCCARFVIKHADAPLDVGLATIALCEIAFFRLAVMTARTRALPDRVSDGWGQTTRLSGDVTADFDLVVDSNVRDRETATRVVTAQAAAIASR